MRTPNKDTAAYKVLVALGYTDKQIARGSLDTQGFYVKLNDDGGTSVTLGNPPMAMIKNPSYKTTPNKDRVDFEAKYTEYFEREGWMDINPRDCAEFFWQAACADRDLVIAELERRNAELESIINEMESK